MLTDQPAVRFILETLEPQAPDSYFAWNFFDGILMQKEYFDGYVFEDTAAELLRKDPALQKALEAKPYLLRTNRYVLEMKVKYRLDSIEAVAQAARAAFTSLMESPSIIDCSGATPMTSAACRSGIGSGFFFGSVSPLTTTSKLS